MDNNIKIWYWKYNNIFNLNFFFGIELLMGVINGLDIRNSIEYLLIVFFYVYMKIKVLCVCVENRNFI